MRRGVALASGILVRGLTPLDQSVLDGVRAPAFAPDGRLASSVAGDLWVLRPDGSGGFTAALGGDQRRRLGPRSGLAAGRQIDAGFAPPRCASSSG